MYCATITVAWCLRARMRMSSRTTSMRISSMDTSKRTRIFPLKVSEDIDPEQGGGGRCVLPYYGFPSYIYTGRQAATPSPPPLPPPLCVFFNFVAISQNSKFMENSSLFFMRAAYFSKLLCIFCPKLSQILQDFNMLC